MPCSDADISSMTFDGVAKLIRALAPGASTATIVYTLPSGHEGRIPVPLPPSMANDGLNETERGIIDTLKASDRPMKRAAVGRAMGRTDITGSFAAAFRRLVQMGRVVQQGPIYTDDPQKLLD